MTTWQKHHETFRPTPARSRPSRSVARARLVGIGTMVATVAVLLSACRELPTGETKSERELRVPESVASIQPPAYCTKVWVGSSDGDWQDATRWNPIGVPTPPDTVCIVAASSYTVTLGNGTTGTWETVQALHLGDGSSAITLRLHDPQHMTLVAWKWLSVRAGAKVLLGSGSAGALTTDSLDNDGTIEVVDQCGISRCGLVFTEKVINHGTLTLGGPTSIYVENADARFENHGTIEVTHDSVAVRFRFQGTLEPSVFAQRAGVIRGTHPLEVMGFHTFTALFRQRFEWYGGDIETIGGADGEAVVQLHRFDLSFPQGGVGMGALDVSSFHGDSIAVEGNVPAAVRVAFGGDSIRYQWRQQGAAPIVNRGTLVLGGTRSTLYAPGLVNLHIVEVEEATSLAADTIVNRGTMQLTAPLTIWKQNGQLINAGIIDATAAGELVMSPLTTYVGTTAGRMTGRLTLDGATLTGVGTVGDVTSLSGVVDPGRPIGTLTAASLALQGGSNLVIDVAGEARGSHDRMSVVGDLSLGGKLVINTHPSFPGGSCGQAITFLTDGSTGARGTFGQVVGMTFPGTLREWRVHAEAGVHILAGFNPIAPLHLTPRTLAVTEGGPSTSLHACLGRSPPVGDVVLTLTPSLGEVAGVPGAGTFTTANWSLPLTFSVSAIDDAVVEAPVMDTLQVATTSADPRYAGLWIPPPTVAVSDNDGNADLSVAFDDAADTLLIGDSTGFRAIISNHGPTSITGGSFTLPSLVGLTVQTVTGVAGCTWSLTRVDCPITALAPGETQVVTIRVVASAIGSHPTSVAVVSEQADPLLANNTASWTFVVR